VFHRARRSGTLASFGTALAPADPFLATLARSAAAKGAARTNLKRSLSRLGRLVADDEAGVIVGPVEENLPGQKRLAYRNDSPTAAYRPSAQP